MRSGKPDGWRRIFHKMEQPYLAELGLFGPETVALDDAAAPHSSANMAWREGGSRNVVRKLIHESHARGKYFDADLFGDPAWDILLHLYEAHEAGQLFRVSHLCAVLNLSDSVVGRWATVLEARGLVKKTGDNADPERLQLMLTEPGCNAMRRYLSSISLKGQGPPQTLP